MAATYRIGPSDVFSPGDLSADADTVQSQIALLDQQIQGNESIDVDTLDQWTAFEGGWKGFYSDHFGGFFSSFFSALNDSNRDDLIRYENQLVSLQAALQPFGVSLVAPLAPSTGAKDNIGDQLKAQGLSLPSTTSIVIIIAAVIGLLLVWKS
jgi:hypothetical protein